MSKHLDDLDRLFADLEDSGDLAELDARQAEALRKAATVRKERHAQE